MVPSNPVRLLQHGGDMRDIVNMVAITVVDAQRAQGDGPEAPDPPGPVAAAEPVPVA